MTNRTQSACHAAPSKGGAARHSLACARWEGATKYGAPGQIFDAEHDDADHHAYAECCEGDRHHFRFIVSPQDAEQLSDLRAFTWGPDGASRRDLGTKLDRIGIDHWNTDNTHVYVIVRGKGHDGRDLVIARDYVCHGLRARAPHLATLGLSDLEIRRDFAAQVEADRWTAFDLALAPRGCPA